MQACLYTVCTRPYLGLPLACHSCCQRICLTTLSACSLGHMHQIPIGSGKHASPCVCNIFCFWQKRRADSLCGSLLLLSANLGEYALGLRPRPNTPDAHWVWKTCAPSRLAHSLFLTETPGGLAVPLVALVADECPDYALGLRPRPNTPDTHRAWKASALLFLLEAGGLALLRGQIAVNDNLNLADFQMIFFLVLTSSSQ